MKYQQSVFIIFLNTINLCLSSFISKATILIKLQCCKVLTIDAITTMVSLILYTRYHDIFEWQVCLTVYCYTTLWNQVEMHQRGKMGATKDAQKNSLVFFLHHSDLQIKSFCSIRNCDKQHKRWGGPLFILILPSKAFVQSLEAAWIPAKLIRYLTNSRYYCV